MLLTGLILCPLAGAALIMLFGRGRPATARALALLTTLLELLLLSESLRIMLGGHVFLLAESGGPTSLWHLAMDGLSAPLVALTAVLGIVAVVASWRVDDSPPAFLALLLGLQAAVTAVFLASDAILFYVAWEAVLVPMFFLIGRWGHENRRHAAVKFFLYTFAGSVVMLAGLIVAALVSGGTTFDRMAGHVPVNLQALVLLLLMVGFLVKLPAFPFHTWLPDAHVEAPTAGSIMLAGVLLKMGGYGILRLGIPLAPVAFHQFAWVLAALGAIGVVYGAFMALAQSDLKRLVAYSSVSHMGFVLIAAATTTTLGIGAALLVMVSHGFVAGLLFLLVGMLYDRTHTREIPALGGLARSMPAWSTVFVLAALASLGLPGLSGFPGEFSALVSSWGPYAPLTVLAAFGTLAAAGYNLWAVARVSYGPTPEQLHGLADVRPHEALAIAPLAVAVVVLGVAPWLVLAPAEPVLRLLTALVTGVRP
jgi:NADH-quinone oxidoreductase subunit M